MQEYKEFDSIVEESFVSVVFDSILFLPPILMGILLAAASISNGIQKHKSKKLAKYIASLKEIQRKDPHAMIKVKNFNVFRAFAQKDIPEIYRKLKSIYDKSSTIHKYTAKDIYELVVADNHKSFAGNFKILKEYCKQCSILLEVSKDVDVQKKRLSTDKSTGEYDVSDLLHVIEMVDEIETMMQDISYHNAPINYDTSLFEQFPNLEVSGVNHQNYESMDDHEVASVEKTAIKQKCVKLIADTFGYV